MFAPYADFKDYSPENLYQDVQAILDAPCTICEQPMSAVNISYLILSNRLEAINKMQVVFMEKGVSVRHLAEEETVKEVLERLKEERYIRLEELKEDPTIAYTNVRRYIGDYTELTKTIWFKDYTRVLAMNSLMLRIPTLLCGVMLGGLLAALLKSYFALFISGVIVYLFIALRTTLDFTKPHNLNTKKHSAIWAMTGNSFIRLVLIFSFGIGIGGILSNILVGLL